MLADLSRKIASSIVFAGAMNLPVRPQQSFATASQAIVLVMVTAMKPRTTAHSMAS